MLKPGMRNSSVLMFVLCRENEQQFSVIIIRHVCLSFTRNYINKIIQNGPKVFDQVQNSITNICLEKIKVNFIWWANTYFVILPLDVNSVRVTWQEKKMVIHTKKHCVFAGSSKQNRRRRCNESFIRILEGSH